MRTATGLVVVLACIIQVAAQQKSTTVPSVSGTLAKLKSPRWMEREKAFGDAVELLQLATSTKDADRLRLGIIQLLDTENQDKTPARNEAEGESHGEFHAGLIGYVGHMGDERTIPALLGAAGTLVHQRGRCVTAQWLRLSTLKTDKNSCRCSKNWQIMTLSKYRVSRKEMAQWETTIS